MISLCNFTEYGCNNGVSIKDSACQQSYPEKQKIVSCLKNEGKCIMVQTKIAKDRLTNERISGLFSLELFSDGKYSWWSDLAYHVDKYNLRLPTEFENYVLNLAKKIYFKNTLSRVFQTFSTN